MSETNTNAGIDIVEIKVTEGDIQFDWEEGEKIDCLLDHHIAVNVPGVGCCLFEIDLSGNVVDHWTTKNKIGEWRYKKCSKNTST